MYFMNRIIEYLNDASDFFYDIYLEVLGWVYPFWLAADFFYDLCLVFNRLAWRFYDFNELLEDWAAEIADILSWSNIRSLIRSWLPDLEDAIDWWDRWWIWVGDEIDDWWRSTKQTVRGWISDAENWLEALINSVVAALTTLQAAWDEWKVKIPSFNEVWAWFSNWWGNTLANVIAWGALTTTQIDTLIDSWFKNYTPFWEGWLDWKGPVIEFFTDPWQWLYDRAEDLFDRFW